jgi:hypothetical protein
MSNAGPHHDPDCIFCKIVAGQIPSRKVYEDEELFAFHDIAPWAPVHFLIMPKAHILSMAHTGAEHERLLGRMMALAPRLALEQGCNPYPTAASASSSTPAPRAGRKCTTCTCTSSAGRAPGARADATIPAPRSLKSG